jgi:hypothetical protein
MFSPSQIITSMLLSTLITPSEKENVIIRPDDNTTVIIIPNFVAELPALFFSFTSLHIKFFNILSFHLASCKSLISLNAKCCEKYPFSLCSGKNFPSVLHLFASKGNKPSAQPSCKEEKPPMIQICAVNLQIHTS